MLHRGVAILHMASDRSPQTAGIATNFGRACGAARCGSTAMAALAWLSLLAACAEPVRIAAGRSDAGPLACSWYGDADDEVLYFGESGFWAAMHQAGGDPTADIESAAPQVVGRFDLDRETMLPSLRTATPLARSGTWDVLVHPNGRVYFTSFYDPAGAIDPKTGAALRFDATGMGLNELALLPDGEILATRYGRTGGGDGSLVVLDAEGNVRAEHPLAPAPGATVAAKSVIADPIRRVAWVNTDLVSADGGRPRHDARVVDLATGREIARFDGTPELQFPTFAPDGRGYFAWVEGTRLVLQVTEPGEAQGPESGRMLLLDDAFKTGVDFAQDLRVQRDGRVVATRWSGAVHVIDEDDEVRTVRLPRTEENGLYYTAVAKGDRVCATYCAGVRVVCADLP